MSQEMVKTEALSPIERVIIAGDISQLKAEERISYYKMICDSVGLNPLTKPFEYLTLNGRLILYARKDCTDQLRSIHKISIKIVGREVVNDCYVVTAQAIKPDGRTDESIGAVSTANLKGDALCNAIMKAETKAKRRVTLSISGLGMLDEAEIETIPARNKKELALVEQEVVLGEQPKVLNAPRDSAGVPGEPESALERKLRESLEMLGAPKIGGPDKPVSAESNGPAKPADTNGYISLDDQRAIHIHAKSFVSKKHEKFARTWVHDFLVTKGVVDENGEGTLTKLKKFYIKDGERLSNINRVREALEPYMKQRDADKLAEETQAI